MTATQNDPLQGLRDIHLPSPVSFWPPAPGWWILAALVLVLIVAGFWLWRRYQRRAYRRSALKQLQQLQLALQQGQAEATILADLSVLLRRTAISRYGRQQVASLHGKDWLTFLDRTGRTTQFTSQGQALLAAPYQRHASQSAAPLLQLAQHWFKVQS
jgi:hypothetical protein